MNRSKIKVYKYRWIVLLIFILINIAVQIQWLTFASIAREARLFYGVTALQIDFFSMIYMIVFLIVCLPAFYVIDTFGIRIGIGIGALLTAIFALIKGFYADVYLVVAVSQTGLAIAQPFILNSATKLASRWFPVNERATAVGFATLSQFIGIVIVFVVTPRIITQSAAGYDIAPALKLYGLISAACSILLLLFLRERPPTPPDLKETAEQFAVFKGIKHIFSKRDATLLIVIFFIGLGTFNAFSTCIDQLSQIKGFSIKETGLVGGIMLIAGIIGAAIVPVFSDRSARRKPYLIMGTVGTALGMIGITFALSFSATMVSSFVLGFFLLGVCAPIGFQFGAEISHPAPESTAQGLVLLSGQISGIIFILGINKIGISAFMHIFYTLLIINVILIVTMKESTGITSSGIQEK